MSADMKMIKQGAEAKIFSCQYLGRNTIVKERFQKNYRHPDLDVLLTKERIKSEARAITRCKSAGIRTPTLYLVDFDRRRIYMELIEDSITVKDFIIKVIQPEKLKEQTVEGDRLSCLKSVAFKIGQTVGRIHKNNIIHGDLTTSNILITYQPVSDGKYNHESFENGEIVLIDFGLAHIESSSEDKGVDLYVLERALISTHNDVPELFNYMLDGYKKENKAHIKDVMCKFEDVRARGRKRTMVG